MLALLSYSSEAFLLPLDSFSSENSSQVDSWAVGKIGFELKEFIYL